MDTKPTTHPTLHIDDMRVELDAVLVEGVATIDGDAFPFDPLCHHVHHIGDHRVRDYTVQWDSDDGFAVTYQLQPEVDEVFAAARRAHDAQFADAHQINLRRDVDGRLVAC